jgi:hypothetical protein
MPSKYDENTKARAVRLVREHRDDYDSEWAAMKAIAGRLASIFRGSCCGLGLMPSCVAG